MASSDEPASEDGASAGDKLDSPSSSICNGKPYWAQMGRVPHNYSKSSTIILIGPRGTGKSTLAYVTAMNLRRKFIDIIAMLESHVDMTSEAYLAKQGVHGYRKTEFELFFNSLTQNPTNCVISCSSQVIEEPSRSFLLQHLSNHPVILITRSEKELKENFMGHPDREKILAQSNAQMKLYRQCSSFEFANLGLLFLDKTDSKKKSSFASILSGAEQQRQPTRRELITLGLKKLEESFLHFLKYILGDMASPDYAIDQLIRRPWKPAEEKSTYFSRALVLPFYDLTTANLDYDMVAVGIDAIVLRIDLMVSWALRKGYDPLFYLATQISFLRSKTTVPIVYHFAKSFFDLNYVLNLDKDWDAFYSEILNLGLRLNVEYLVVWKEFTYSLEALVKRKNHTKIIMAYTTVVWDFDHLKTLQNQVVIDGCDILMITSHAVSLKDNFDVSAHLNFISRDRVPIIAYNNGPLGKTSIALCRMLSPVENPIFYDMPNSFYQLKDGPWTTEFHNKKREDILSLQEVNIAIHSLFLLPKLQYYHFGKYVSRRISSKVYQAAFDFLSLPHRYSDGQGDDISQLQPIFQQFNFGGGAVSQPFKSRIMDILDSVSLDARLIGAVNTVKTIRNTRTMQPISFLGENTDWVATHNCVTKYLNAKNSITSNTQVVVIGAGGTARATIYSLIRLGVKKFYIYNRTRANATKMIQHFESMFSSSLMPSFPLENPQPDMTLTAVNALRLHPAGDIMEKRRQEGRDEPAQSSVIPRPGNLADSSPAAASTSRNSSPAAAPPTSRHSSPPTKRQKVSDLLIDKPARRDFGTLSFEQNPQENILQFKILDSLNEPWDEKTPYPTMLFQCTSSSKITVHDTWLLSPTGGIALDVSLIFREPLFHFF